jgi:hypothetical protein
MTKHESDPNENGALWGYPYEVAERAAIYEHDAGMSKEEAEQKAIDDYHKDEVVKAINKKNKQNAQK